MNRNEKSTFGEKNGCVLGVLFKFLFILLAFVYLLRALSPFLFKQLFSSIAKKAEAAAAKEQMKQERKSQKDKSRTPPDDLGEYIDYEEID